MACSDLFNSPSLVRQTLTDVRHVCSELGLLEGPRSFQKQAGGLLLRCPAHDDRTPSCSVRLAKDGTIAVKCHACGFSGDVLTLIAKTRGWNLARDFRDVLREGARIGGLWNLLHELERTPSSSPKRPSPRPPFPLPPADRDYPPEHEVTALWAACTSVCALSPVRQELERRALDPSAIEDLDLARAIPDGAPLPPWASYRGGAASRQSWSSLGYHLVLPVYDARGRMRSLRAWRITPGEGPKRLPPSGYKVAGLLLADGIGRSLLAAGRWQEGMDKRIVLVEGEPDFLTWATRFSDSAETVPAVFGLVSGSWTDEIATRIPSGARVIVRTDHDRAGDAYAARVHASLTSRCTVLRSKETT